MAEEDLEEELNIPDEAEDHLEEDLDEAALEEAPQSFFTRKRMFLIAGISVAVLVFVLIVILFLGSKTPKKKKTLGLVATQQQTEKEVEKKKSRRKKKIKYEQLFAQLSPVQTMQVIQELSSMLNQV